LARLAGTVWRLEEHAQEAQPLGQERGWQRLFEHLAAKADNEYAMIDSTIGRAHQHRAGAQKNDDQAIGRSKGGLSTKIHALVDALGNPLRFLLTPGQADDLIGADALLPQMAAEVLISDKAYDADEGVLKPLASAGKSTVIPPRQNRTTPRQFDEALYQTHHLIENSSVNSNSTAASPPRYNKTARNFLAALYLAAATIWLNWRQALV